MSDHRSMTCEQLDEQLSSWLEHDLDSVTRAALERHAAACPRCAEIIADLASLRRAAASLPELVPSRDLWPEIEARIQAPVIPLEKPVVAPRRSRSTWWMGAAAAGLVAVTAGVTYWITNKGMTEGTTAAADSIVAPKTDTVGPVLVIGPDSTLAEDSTPSEPSAERFVRERPRPSGPALAASAPAEQSEYARDVARLRAIVTERRSELDSTTIAVLEKNLELIDRAIAESRAALQRDPASEFLADQLTRAMTKKVAILRTAALLPARS